jgi:hypothetical protein
MAVTAERSATAPDVSDSADRLNDLRYRQRCDQLRAGIEASFRAALGGETLLTRKDMDEYLATMTTGAKDAEEEFAWLQDHREKYAPQMIAEARTFARKLKDVMSVAKSEGGLTAANAENLQKAVLSRRSGGWGEVKRFFRGESAESLQSWVSNWKKVAEKQKKVNALRQKSKTKGAGLPAVAALDTAKFKSGKVTERLQMLDAALAALANPERNEGKTERDAKAILLRAAGMGGILTENVPASLAEILQKYKGPALDKFVYGKLPGYVSGWVSTAKQYAQYESASIKQKVTIMPKAEFLALSYAPRRTELVNIKRALDAAASPPLPPAFGKIQERIDAQDFPSAGTLLRATSATTLTPEHRSRLGLLQKQLDARKKTAAPKEPQTAPKDPAAKTAQAYDELKDAMGVFATGSVQSFILDVVGESKQKALVRQDTEQVTRYSKRFGKALYNVQWGVEHNWLNDKNVSGYRERAKADTEKVQEQGYKARGVVNVDVNAVGTGELRPYENGHRGLSIYHFGNNGDDRAKLKQEIDKRGDNFNAGYWTDFLPKDATLTQVGNIVSYVLPKLKKFTQAKEELSHSPGTPSMDLSKTPQGAIKQ